MEFKKVTLSVLLIYILSRKLADYFELFDLRTDDIKGELTLIINNKEKILDFMLPTGMSMTIIHYNRITSIKRFLGKLFADKRIYL